MAEQKPHDTPAQDPQELTPETQTPDTAPGEELSPLESLQNEVAALTERNLRLAAEYDNYRKRTQRERERIHPEAVAGTLTALLPLLDNFQRALETPCTDESYQKGVQMIYDNLWEILTGLGVEEIGAPGEAFDPQLHNAVMHMDDDTLDKNCIAQVFQKGYKLKDRVLRHAMVQVAN